jgi:opacity protein-like surface antigen
MKKIFVLVLAVCMMAGIANAQKTYIRLGVGGGIGLKQYEGESWADETNTSNSDNFVIKSAGMGGGLNVNLAFGYMLSDYVGIELGVNEFIGLNKKVHSTYTSSSADYTYDAKMSGMMLQIVPAIVITPGLKKTNPYARMGMIVGILPSITQSYSATTNTNGGFKATSTSESKLKISGGVALGFTAAAGVSMNLSEKLSFFGELVFNGITYAPSKGEVTEWTVDGVDQLPDATTNEKEWTYEKEYDADEEIPDGSPDKLPKTSSNFSNVELNIGIILKL